MTFLAIRGATTCENDSKEEITRATQELVSAILDKNSIAQKHIVSMLFTATPDLVSEFPATAARSLGLDDVPLMCAQELNVTGSMPRCIRVMIHIDADRQKSDIHHIFLGNAKALRKDLTD